MTVSGAEATVYSLVHIPSLSDLAGITLGLWAVWLLILDPLVCSLLSPGNWIRTLVVGFGFRRIALLLPTTSTLNT